MLNPRNAKYISRGCLLLALLVTVVAFNSGLGDALQSKSPDLLIHFIAFGVAVFLVLLAILIPYYARKRH